MKHPEPSSGGTMVGRRRTLAIACALPLLFLPGLAWGGTYLTRGALLLSGANSDTNYLRAHVNDVELARVVKRLAEARLAAARDMDTPKAVAQAHPHLLLVLENFERAAQAAVERDVKAFIVLHARARDEEQTYRGVLKQLGFTLPEAKR